MKKYFNSTAIALVATTGVATGFAENASAETVDFRDNGTFHTTSYAEGNVIVTGSNLIAVTSGLGIGVVGGIDHVTVDPGETITFDFRNPVTDVVINDFQSFDTDGNGILYLDATLYAYNEAGQLTAVAVQPIDPNAPIDVMALLPQIDGLSSLDIVMNFDSIIVGSISSQELDDSPVFACAGFTAPFDKPLSLKNRSKRTIPVNITLTNDDSVEMTDLDIISPPVVTIAFSSTVSADGAIDDALLDSSLKASEGNTFAYNYDKLAWEYRLATKAFSSAGTYMVSVASGDDSEYQIDAPGGACVQTFVRQP